MSRSKNILVVLIAIFVVLTAGIIHVIVILGGIEEAPAEWKDYFVLNGIVYFNSYNVIDDGYTDRLIGKIASSVPRGADASEYAAKDGEAVYLPAGTEIYSIKGFDVDFYTAAIDNGECFLYCADDVSPTKVVEECGVKSLRKELDFKRYFIDTVCVENSSYGIRIAPIKSLAELDDYLSRYVNDFHSVTDDTFTYDDLFEDRNYDESFFKEKRLIRRTEPDFSMKRIPEDDGKVVYDVESITSNDVKTTLLLVEKCLPASVTYDKCTVRHMFVELSADDYSDQKLTYQVERQYLHIKDDFSGSTRDVMEENEDHFLISLIRSRSDAIGTVYESFVLGEYKKDFFDTSALVIVRSVDDEEYRGFHYEGLREEDDIVFVDLVRSSGEKAPSAGRDYFVIPVSLSQIDSRVILPFVDESEDTVPSSDGRNDLKDVLVIDNIRMFEKIDEKYKIGSSLYDEEFFENYVLFFAGFLTFSPDVAIDFSGVTNAAGVFELCVNVTVPSECVFKPCFRPVCVPYLRSDYNGEALNVIVERLFENEDEDETQTELVTE